MMPTRRLPRSLRTIVGAFLLLVTVVAGRAGAATLDEAAATRFASLALRCVHQEYPNKISHTLQGDADVQPPRTLTPAFYGCYDWHSSVHGHWLLARLARQFPGHDDRHECARGAGAEPDPGQDRSGGRVLPHAGTRLVRAPVRARVAPAARRGVARLGRPAGARVVAGAAAARGGIRRAPAHVAAPPALPDPRGGTQPDRVCVRPGPRLGAHRRGRGNAPADRIACARILRRGRRMPARLRALRRGFPVAVHRRSGPHATAAAVAGVRDLAAAIPARSSRATAARRGSRPES